MRAVVRMCACVSLDGRIAASEDSPPNQEKRGGWTSAEDKEQFKAELGRADIVVVGRKTAELMPNVGKPTIIISRAGRVTTRQKGLSRVLEPRRAELEEFLNKNHNAKVLLCGGSMTYALFLQHDLVDELVLTIEPVVLHTGPSLGYGGLFNTEASHNKFQLVRSNHLGSSGTIRIEYRRTLNGHSVP